MAQSEPRTKAETVDEYLKQFPVETKERLEQIRTLIKQIAPEATEVISYAIPAFKLPNQGRAFVYFSGYPKHIGLYPLPKGDDKLSGQIEPFVAGKGTLRFPLDQPLPLPLIKKVVTQLKKNNQ